MLAAPASFNPAEMLRLRRELWPSARVSSTNARSWSRSRRKDCPFISDKAILHYRDIYDHSPSSLS